MRWRRVLAALCVVAACLMLGMGLAACGGGGGGASGTADTRADFGWFKANIPEYFA